ncbi:MAG: hypothetical protein JST51_19825 [Armatimonadetes bacterium]|nr:hypothetical protein [Armatimonadota bacterium]
MKRWQIFLLLLVVAFLPYSVAIFSGQELGPTEHIQTMVTPDAPKPGYGWDVLQADGVLQFLPWRDLVFDSWRHGQAPILNPYQLAGQPLTANSQSGGFYLPHMVFAFLPGSTGFKILLLGILHLFLAAWGLFAFLRNLKVSEGGALLGATAFALSQFMVAWAPLASVPTTVAWIPWVLAGITMPNRRLGFFLTALATAMMIYAGHLQFAFYGMFAAFVVWVWTAISVRKVSVLATLLALFVGVAASAPQLGIVLKNSATSHRRNTPTEQGYQGYSKGVLAPYEALSLVNPKLLGDPSIKTSEIEGSGVPNGYWSMFVKPGANPAECALWVTPIAFSLGLFALFARRGKDEESASVTVPVSLVVLGVLLAFGSPLNQLLFFYFPGWSATGSPGRAHILIVLGLCLLGAIGYDRLEAKGDGSKKWLAIGLIPLVLLGLGFNLMNMLGGMLGQPGDDSLGKIIGLTTKPYLPGIAISALLSAVVLALYSSKKLPKMAALPAVLAALTLLGQHPLSGKPLEVPNLNIPSQERKVFASQSWSMVTTPKATMPPNIASLARVHDLYGYDSILDAKFVEKLKTVGDPFPPENGNLALLRAKSLDDLTVASTKALVDLGVKHPVSADSMSGIPTSDSRINGGDIIDDGYDHQTIKPAPGATEILVRDRYFPGMKTSTPNTTVEDRDGWRLIKTDGQQSTIRIDYSGRTNFIGVIIGIGILLLGTLLSIRKHEPNASAT